jgi:hypothetical protein
VVLLRDRVDESTTTERGAKLGSERWSASPVNDCRQPSRCLPIWAGGELVTCLGPPYDKTHSGDASA